ncbi:MAG: hypothetical protein ACOYYJ_12875, partial [Chloroflexota bacterium]
MKVERSLSLIFGLALVAIGAISLLGNTLLTLQAWRLWPLTVIIAGIALTIPGFFGLKQRGFGSFFIPGIPLLTTGGILMLASLLDNWEIWALAWPLEVISLALGFALAAIFMRVAGLAIPAIIIGVNGLVLGFCNLTGLWAAWALLWPVEPLSVGLGLLVLGFVNRSAGAKLAGMILTGIAGAGFFIASFISVFNDSVLRFAVPAMLVLSGLVLVGAQWFKREEPTPG